MPAYPTLWRRGTPAMWSDLFNTRREMDSLFDRFFTTAAGSTAVGLQPVVDVRETDQALEVVAELPGIRPDDVEVNLENNVLTISGEKKQETTGNRFFWVIRDLSKREKNEIRNFSP